VTGAVDAKQVSGLGSKPLAQGSQRPWVRSGTGAAHLFRTGRIPVTWVAVTGMKSAKSLAHADTSRWHAA
jgi:hypothetical protein